ncbi:DnaB-like helicase C-terminal domain-containing protein [Ahrensia sp. R2A130]|uniref:DnaB-like helicase C-terminal domain-containing protein n=1 Tax=Ahrensia sp. R2A130 TaxID=744979 RepID=UPI0001E0BCAD|nr:DnaB-like helicase C-terminal domain-containing protein [Ahrensia sp. R2A130]EFL88309.1 conserved hypothetical protein [Ahrensia sp. R2A130]
MASHPEIERLIVGAILLKPSQLDTVQDRLLPRMFTSHVFGDLYGCICDLAYRGMEVTKAAVLFQATDDYDGEKAEAVVSASIHAASSQADAPPLAQYAKQMIDAYQRRELVKAVEESGKELRAKAKPADEIIGAMQGQLDEIMAVGGASPIARSDNPGAAIFDAMAKAHQEGVKEGIPLPLKEMEDVMSVKSVPAGRLNGLLSSSGEGKTSLTMQILLAAAEAGHPVCLFSYDQSEKECVHQMIAQKYGITTIRQEAGDLGIKEWDQVKEFTDWYSASRFHVVQCGRETVGQLVRMCGAFQRRYGVSKPTLFAFDHIGKIQTDSKKDQDAGSRAGEIARELKAFMRTNNAAGLVLQQRNGFGMRRDNPRPISQDLFGGEGAKADFDCIIYLYRREKYRNERSSISSAANDEEKLTRIFGSAEAVKGKAELGVIKNRFGQESRRSSLTFDAPFTRYVSEATTADQEHMF